MQKFVELRHKEASRLNFEEYRDKLQNIENLSFAAQIFNRYVKAKGFCVQNLVFLRVYTICKIESTIQKRLAGPKLIFAFESTRQTCPAV